MTNSGGQLACRTAIYVVVILGIVKRYPHHVALTDLFTNSHRRHHLWYHPADLERQLDDTHQSNRISKIAAVIRYE